MKADRRWWNDGRLASEREAERNRDRAPDDIQEHYRREIRDVYGPGFEVDVRVNAHGGYHVNAWPAGARFRVTLPSDKETT